MDKKTKARKKYRDCRGELSMISDYLNDTMIFEQKSEEGKIVSHLVIQKKCILGRKTKTKTEIEKALGKLKEKQGEKCGWNRMNMKATKRK